jgi:hypothetical protein
MSLIGHLAASLFRAFFRIVFTALFCAALAAGAVLLVSDVYLHQWPPTPLTLVTLAVLAVLAAYAGGLTVLVNEAVRGVRTAEKDVGSAVEAVEKDVTGRK